MIRKLDNFIYFLLVLLAFSIPFSKSAIEVIASLAILSWIIKIIAERRFHRNAIFLPLSAFLIANFLSIFSSQNLFHSLDSFVGKILEYSLICYIASDTINSRRRSQVLINALILSALVISFDAFWQYKTGFDIFRHRPVLENGRIEAIFVTANDLGAYFINILPLAGAFLVFSLTKIKLKFISIVKNILLSTLFISMITAFYLTNSKGAFLGFAIAVLLMVLLSRRRKLIIFTIGAIAIMSVILIGKISSNTIQSSQVYDRAKIWQGTILMIKDKPVLGHGVGSFMGTYGHKYYAGRRTEQKFTYAHNCILQITAETGLLGFFTFLWLFIAIFYKLTHSLNCMPDKFSYFYALGFIGAITAGLVHSLLDTNLYSLQQASLFWLITGVAIGFSKIAKNSVSQN